MKNLRGPRQGQTAGEYIEELEGQVAFLVEKINFMRKPPEIHVLPETPALAERERQIEDLQESANRAWEARSKAILEARKATQRADLMEVQLRIERGELDHSSRSHR